MLGRVIALCAISVISAGGLLAASPGTTDRPVSAAVPKAFHVFDATLYKNKPPLGMYDFHPLSILYEWRLIPGDSPAGFLPAERLVRTIAGEYRGVTEPLVIDIERWPLKGGAADVQSTVGRFASVLAWVKNEIPGVRIGVYGTVPLPDYWRAIRDPRSPEYRSWQRDNDQLEDLVAQVDALFPSLYTFYPDRQGWVTYAIAQLTEAKRKANGKPVYAFLWPQYHESNRLLGLRRLDPDYWELELKTVYQYADGVVIWGGWGDKGPELWDEDAPWWQVTKRFLAALPATSHVSQHKAGVP